MRNKISERIHRHHLKRAKKQQEKRYSDFCKNHGGNLEARQTKNVASKPSLVKEPKIHKMKNQYIWDETRKCTVKVTDALTQEAQSAGMYETPNE